MGLASLVVAGCRVGFELPDEDDLGLGGAVTTGGVTVGDGDSGGNGNGDGSGGIVEPGDGDGDAAGGMGDGDGDGSGGSDVGAGGRIGYGSGDGGGSSAEGTGGAGASGGTGSGGDVSAGGATSGGAAGDGGSSGGGASGGSGGSNLTDIVVTTGADEADPDATVQSPGGSGLSLREALLIANAAAGEQTITLQSDLLIVLGSALPTITDALRMEYEPGVTGLATIEATAVPGMSPCLAVDGSNVRLSGLVILNCPNEPVELTSGSGNELNGNLFSNPGASVAVGGSNPVVLFNFVLGGGGAGIYVSADNAQILANWVQDTAGAGIVVANSASDATVFSNLVFGAPIGVVVEAAHAKVWHNTFSGNDAGLYLSGATRVDFRNNIIASSSSFGIIGSSGDFAELGYNLFHQNAAGNCSDCALDGTAILADPLFVNPAADDFTLQPDSPAIDMGADLGMDRLPFDAEDYAGAAPDIGFVEFEP